MLNGRRLVTAAVLIAIAARAAVIVARPWGPIDDPDNYLAIARSLASGEGYRLDGRPTAYRPPLYPLVLSVVVWGFGPSPGPAIFALHTALGAATVVLTWAAARRWGFSTTRSAVAAFIVALDPVLISQARLVMTETLAAALVALTLFLLAGPGPLASPLLGGLGFGLATLCRPGFLPAAALTAVAALGRGPGLIRLRSLRAGLILLGVITVLAPWAARNARVFGEPVWTTTHGGYTLALANNPGYYDEVLDGPLDVWSGPRQRAWWKEINWETAGLLEPRADRILRDRALATIAERPRDFLWSVAARVGRFWGLAPSGEVYSIPLRFATAFWTAPLWIALVGGLVRPETWRWPRVVAPALILALTLVHAVYWTDMRMRAPLVPAIALVASAAGWPRRDAPDDAPESHRSVRRRWRGGEP